MLQKLENGFTIHTLVSEGLAEDLGEFTDELGNTWKKIKLKQSGAIIEEKIADIKQIQREEENKKLNEENAIKMQKEREEKIKKIQKLKSIDQEVKDILIGLI